MNQSALSPSQVSILAEIGRLYLVRESHEATARVCTEQIQKLRVQLEQLERVPQQT